MRSTVRALALAITALTLTSGCAGRQMIDPNEPLPLSRVMLYRNGVGYFERSGRVEGDQIRFRVRRENVADFLATLSVVDGNGQAQSVSFPSVEEGGEESDHVEVVVGLHGANVHDVRVAYVSESPIWRPTYRVVLDGDEAALQGWAVVQNGSGEPWDDVHMSVSSGAPLSFRADLSRTVIPTRPTVTDTGQVVMGPVYSETTLSTSENRDEDRPDMVEAEHAVSAPATVSARVSRRSAGQHPGHQQMESPTGPPASFESLLGSTQGSSPEGDGSAFGGGTRYDVPGLVTVPDSGSTLVAILDERVPSEDALLYRPDPSVPQSSTYPMRVLRLRNQTEVLLERGPIAIYESDSLLGQGLLSPLAHGALTTIPFAIERGVVVRVDNATGRTPARLVTVARGRVTVEEFNERRTTYTINNATNRGTRLYLRHSRTEGWEIVDPPEGTETVEQASLLPVVLPSQQETVLEVVERSPVRRTVDFMSEPASQAVSFYLEGPAIDAAGGPALRRAVELRDRLGAVGRDHQSSQTQRGELRQAAAEVHAHLQALENNERAQDLRDRLVARLAELTARIDGLTNGIVELELERSELQIRLAEALRDLTLTA